MKYFFLLLSFLIISKSYSQVNVKQYIEKMNEQENQVLKTVKAWNEAFAKNDPDTYFNFLHSEITLFIASSPYRIDGKTVDREEFEWSLSNGRTRVAFFQELQPKIQVLGNTAIVTYHNRGAYGPEGQEQIYYLKETDILVMEGNEWKIIHIHVSK